MNPVVLWPTTVFDAPVVRPLLQAIASSVEWAAGHGGRVAASLPLPGAKNSPSVIPQSQAFATLPGRGTAWVSSGVRAVSCACTRSKSGAFIVWFLFFVRGVNPERRLQ